uniref:Uncharacterized protein n=1 Tax=Alexandrium catenella TaxID=2925 RepID=A0A7S1S178_ALECA|mmetsp:Transcript_8119/g.22032  ORF Transcript_8119/g.22032 Transcript_8119/m.22032 type:complete len:182 (+) Transcript_8119:46-591(+)
MMTCVSGCACDHPDPVLLTASIDGSTPHPSCLVGAMGEYKVMAKDLRRRSVLIEAKFTTGALVRTRLINCRIDDEWSSGIASTPSVSTASQSESPSLGGKGGKAAAEEWTQYVDGDGRIWWYHEPSSEFFYADDSGPWTRWHYEESAVSKLGKRRFWWSNSDAPSRWFYEEDPSRSGSLVD